MKSIAKSVYSITNKNDLKRFTAHSLRVGACVALHMAGAKTLDIKNRLRWKSDSFLTYLRDMPQLGDNHNAFINIIIQHLQI